MPRDTYDYTGPPPEQETEPDTLVIADQSLRLGFIQLPKLILYARNLTRDAKLLYAILLGYAWQQGRCFPGYGRLCYDMGASENTVRVYMRELEQAGLLHQRRRGLGKTNIYTLLDLRTSKIEVQEPQRPRTSKIEVQEPAKTEVAEHKETEVYKETEEEEIDQQETEIISNDINSNVFHSNYNNGQLSTSLSTRSTVDNKRRGGTPSDNGDTDRAANGMTRLRDVLERRQLLPTEPAEGNETVPRPSARGRPPKAPDFLAVTIEEITHRLNDDPKNVRSNTTRAVRLWKDSGLPADKFVTSVLYKARSLAQAQGTVKKRAAAGTGGPINRVPYFFAVVEDLLGLKEQARP